MKEGTAVLRRCFAAALIAALVFISAGCSVKFVSSYDEQTDRSVTALHKKVGGFLVRLEKLDGLPECIYPKHKAFYEDAGVDLSSIRMRAAAIPNNALTIEQVGLLGDNLGLLERLHKTKEAKGPGKNCLSKEEIEPLRTNFDTSFTAILKLELAKKRGDAN